MSSLDPRWYRGDPNISSFAYNAQAADGFLFVKYLLLQRFKILPKYLQTDVFNIPVYKNIPLFSIDKLYIAYSHDKKSFFFQPFFYNYETSKK